MADRHPGANPSRPRILTLLCGGGFLYETQQILNRISGHADMVYLSTPLGGTPGTNDIPAGPHRIIPMFATVTKASIGQRLKSVAQTVIASAQMMIEFRVSLVFVVGASYAVPMLLAARLCGRKTIYIESITRADRLSNTGALIYASRLASVFVVQWPDLAKTYPRSVIGTIL